MSLSLPISWSSLLDAETAKPYWADLESFVEAERRAHVVFPPEPDVFNALAFTPPAEVRVVILGQDPYHDDGQAHGLCFSVLPGKAVPPSLANIFQEMHSDIGARVPNNGYLATWAEQGVLMLNAVLTVRAHQPNSHRGHGWEQFTDAVLRCVNGGPRPVVFVLWGGHARKKRALIDTSRHTVIESAHPSPLSARNGFFGSRPFSRINDALARAGTAPIDWQVPDR